MQPPPPRSFHRSARRVLLTLLLAPATALAQSAEPAPAAPPAAQAPTAPVSGAAITLDQALAALPGSVAYQRVQLALASAQAQYDAARAAGGLTAGVSGNGSYSSAGTTAQDGSASSATTLSATATLSAPLLPWSNAALGLQQATRSLATARANFAQGVAGLRVSVYQAYAKGVAAQQNLEIATRSLQLAERTLAQQQAAQALNNATAATVQGAQASVLSAQTTQRQAQADLDSARRALGNLTARDLSGATFEATGSDVPALPTLEQALAAARTFSPDLQAAQAALQAAQSTLAQAQRDRAIPAATLTAGYGAASKLTASLNVQSGVGSLSYSQPLLGGASGSGSSAASFTLGLNASFNVLDPGADAQIRSDQVAVQSAQAAVLAQQQTVEQTLRDTYSSAQIAQQAIRDREAALTQTTTALNTAQARLQAGTGTETELQQAQLAQLQAQRDLIAARFTALAAAAQLSALTGP
ncbi:TolC family protein [Deinococcus sonorensis]|uniref:TolC family protein n=2 Tax=Deinococcus sonorensis TaxID=309891 RepID=A0AAU7UD88_9DEIO